MEIKLFYCGFCNERKRKAMIRSNLREHLREVYGIKNNITNSSSIKQRWWIEKEI